MHDPGEVGKWCQPKADVCMMGIFHLVGAELDGRQLSGCGILGLVKQRERKEGKEVRNRKRGWLGGWVVGLASLRWVG